jgi:hypothetical protein
MAGCLAGLRFGLDGIPAWMTEQLDAFENVFDPWDWTPDKEIPYTEKDVAFRKELAASRRKTKKRKAPKPEKQAVAEAIDLFEFLEMGETEEMLEPVLFASKGGDPAYMDFSNFGATPFELGGKTWPTVEHYFQAMKTEDEGDRELIRKAGWPGEAKRLGRRVVLRDQWDAIKYDIMFGAVRAKFDQHPKLMEALLATGNRPLHEDRPDPWWGGGPNYPKGKDWMGMILTDLRDLFRGGG